MPKITSDTTSRVHSFQPYAPTPRSAATQLLQAIEDRNISEVEHLLWQAIALTPDQRHAVFERAWQDKGCPSVVRRALLEHFAIGHQSKLDLAVRHDDLLLAEQSLQQGAVAHPHHFDGGSVSMRSLLLRAQRKSILYPPGAGRERDTPLDQALRNGNYLQARTLLAHEVTGMAVRKAWSTAVKQERLDILRALLLLGSVDRDLGFRLEESVEEKIKDHAILQVMKEVPQYSPKRDPMFKFTGKVKDPISGKEVGLVCRHLVELRQAKNSIIPPINILEAAIDRAKNMATEVHLIDNRQFGSFIVRQFGAMEKSNMTSRQIMMDSSNHSMSVELHIKRKNGHIVYVMKFYEPNRSIAHIRSARSDRRMFAMLDFNQFLQANDLKKYYPESKPVSVMYVRPPEGNLKSNVDLSAIAAADRRLTSVLNGKDVDGMVIWHLLARGFAGSLRDLKNEIESLPETKRVALLTTARADGTPAFFFSLQNGHATTVTAVGELLKLLPDGERAALLAAQRADGVPGFKMAWQNGHTATARAFGVLLSEQTPSVISSFYWMLNDRAKPAFVELLKLVTEDQRIQLLAAAAMGLKSAEKKKLIASTNECIEMCRAFLPQLTEDHRKRLRDAIMTGNLG